MKIILAMILIASATSRASAGFYDGNSLLDECDTNSNVVPGYVMGVTDATANETEVVDSATGELFKPKQFICIPQGVKSKQIVDVVCIYLRENPALRQIGANYLVKNALIKAWPCS